MPWRHEIFLFIFHIYDVDCTVAADLNAGWMVDSCALLVLVVCEQWDLMIFESRLESVEAGRKWVKLLLSRIWQFLMSVSHLRKMIAFSSESVFVGDVAHLNKLSIWCCVRIRSLSYLRLILTASVLQIATFVGLNSVASWVAVLIAAIMRNFILVWSYWNDISIGLIRRLLGDVVMLLRFVLLLVTLMAERLRLGVVERLLVVTVVAGHKKVNFCYLNYSMITHLLCEPCTRLICAYINADSVINCNFYSYISCKLKKCALILTSSILIPLNDFT